jgi:hypothetical protein
MTTDSWLGHKFRFPFALKHRNFGSRRMEAALSSLRMPPSFWNWIRRRDSLWNAIQEASSMLITSSSACSAAWLKLRLIVPEKCHLFGLYINILFYITLKNSKIPLLWRQYFKGLKTNQHSIPRTIDEKVKSKYKERRYISSSSNSSAHKTATLRRTAASKTVTRDVYSRTSI